MGQSDTIRNMEPLSLYIHIPFCQVKCPYCDFYSVANGEDHISQYGEILQKEIAYFATRVPSPHSVSTIFFGGGTPSYVPATMIEKTLENLRAQFSIHKNAEITLEMNPGSCDASKLKDYRTVGINRISLGIQSFHEKELRFLGRVHTNREAHEAIEAVRKADFNNFNMDFIFALPGQTLHQWNETLSQALAYNPPHLSAYNLTYEEGTTLFTQRQAGTIKPLNDNVERKMYQRTIQRVTSAGLDHYEISNFAMQGMEAQHNLAYWRGSDYLGLGVGAHSFLNGKRFSKKRSLKHYLRTTSETHVDLEHDEDLGPERRFWEMLAIGLRDLRGVDTQALALRWGIPTEEKLWPKIGPWLREGFLERNGGRLHLAPKGLMMYDHLARNLI
jgi:oxygen-independent coproporphyrinogen III oxidase